MCVTFKCLIRISIRRKTLNFVRFTVKIYKKSAPSKNERGCTSLENQPLEGRTKLITTDENIEFVQNIILSYRHVKV